MNFAYGVIKIGYGIAGAIISMWITMGKTPMPQTIPR